MLLNHKGQSTLEYAVLIAVVVAALLAIQIYMKRGVEGKLRSASDDIGQQFDAHRTESQSITTRTGTSVEVTNGGSSVTYGDGINLGSEPEVSTRKETETVGSWSE